MHYSLGLGESSLDHRRREEFPAVSNIYDVSVKSISVPYVMTLDIL